MGPQMTLNNQNNSEQKENVGRIIIPDFKFYYHIVTGFVYRNLSIYFNIYYIYIELYIWFCYKKHDTVTKTDTHINGTKRQSQS